MRLFARTAEVSVEKYTEATVRRENDLLAIEEPLEIRVIYEQDGATESCLLSLTMRTPGQDEALGLGFLYAEGIINSMEDIAALDATGIAGRDKPFASTLEITLQPHVSFDPSALQRNFFSTSSCGVCGRLSLDHLPDHPCVPTDTHQLAALKFSPTVLYELPDRINLSQSLFRHTGGIHAAALFDQEGRLLHLCEDVGRHNAMDKVIGEALASKMPLPLSNHVILFSGRVSYELVQKTVVAGIPVIAAIGAPSSLAVEIAQSYNITLIGFLRDRRFNVYSVPERILPTA